MAPDGPEDELSAGNGLGEALGMVAAGGATGVRRPMETGFCQRWGVPGGRE